MTSRLFDLSIYRLSDFSTFRFIDLSIYDYRLRFASLLSVLILLLSSCADNTESPSSDEPTELKMEVYKLTDTQAMISIVPERNECFYYYELVADSIISAGGMSDEQYMQHCMDSLQRRYRGWAEAKKAGGSNPYIADFGSFCFSYGTVTKHYITLRPNTDYQLLAFCAMPKQCRATGRLQRLRFRTNRLDTVYVSPMTIDIALSMYAVDEEGCMDVLVRPTEPTKGKESSDPYFIGCLEQEDLQQIYNDDITAYIEEQMDSIARRQEFAAENIHFGIKNISYAGFEQGRQYVVVAVPYFTSWRKKFFLRSIIYKPGTYIGYGHD